MKSIFTLPPYKVRRNSRAKYPRIVIDSKNGTPNLEVVLPSKFDEAGVPAFIEGHRLWIAKHWEKQMKETEQRRATMSVPSEVRLSAVDEAWRLERDSEVQPSCLVYDGGVLKISPNTKDSDAVSLLRDWLCGKAKFHIMPMMWRLSDEFGFHELKGVRVRCQKTLWGSCSRSGVVSLNCKLLFLPLHLVKHILLHELCHLREMNHSAKFHALLNKFDPDARAHSALVRDQWQFVPGWLER